MGNLAHTYGRTDRTQVTGAFRDNAIVPKEGITAIFLNFFYLTDIQRC